MERDLQRLGDRIKLSYRNLYFAREKIATETIDEAFHGKRNSFR